MEQKKYEEQKGQACERGEENRRAAGEQSVVREQQNYVVTRAQLLNDLKLLTDGIFEGETRDAEGAIVLAFPNGQTFRIAVEELG